MLRWTPHKQVHLWDLDHPSVHVLKRGYNYCVNAVHNNS